MDGLLILGKTGWHAILQNANGWPAKQKGIINECV